jgi:hypothetical protein
MLRMILFQVLLFPSAALFAQQRLTVSCDEPKGSRFDFSSGEFRQSEDGFKGVNPVFIYDDATPNKLMFIWGATRTVPKELFPDEAEDATIVSFSENKITAIYADPLGAVLLFSLFPKEGVVYFTQHRYLFFSMPNTSSYYCNCIFKYSDK